MWVKNTDFPPLPPSSEEEEEEEAHRETKRMAEHEAERMWGDKYERPEGSGKAPMDPKASFMQVINDMLASQRAMTQSLAHVVDRLAIVGTPGIQTLHTTQGNSGVGSRPQ
jgi:hypothetical protein